MEGVYEAVVDRLAMLGYTVTDADETGLKYTIRKCEAELLANINHRKLPPPLFYILVDMVAGQYFLTLSEKDLERVAPAVIEKKLEALLREAFNV